MATDGNSNQVALFHLERFEEDGTFDPSELEKFYPQDETPTFNEFEKPAEYLGKIISWLGNSADLPTFGKRAMALCYVLRPGMFPFPTASTFAEAFGVSRQNFNLHVSSFRNLTGGRFKAPWMRQESAREVYSAVQRESWKSRPRKKETAAIVSATTAENITGSQTTTNGTSNE